MSPYKERLYDEYWRCSWMCGFKSKTCDEVINHENRKHKAVSVRHVKSGDVRHNGFQYFGLGRDKE